MSLFISSTQTQIRFFIVLKSHTVLLYDNKSYWVLLILCLSIGEYFILVLEILNKLQNVLLASCYDYNFCAHLILINICYTVSTVNNRQNCHGIDRSSRMLPECPSIFVIQSSHHLPQASVTSVTPQSSVTPKSMLLSLKLQHFVCHPIIKWSL